MLLSFIKSIDRSSNIHIFLLLELSQVSMAIKALNIKLIDLLSFLPPKQANHASPFIPLTSPTIMMLKKKRKAGNLQSTLTWFDAEEWVVAELSLSVQTSV